MKFDVIYADPPWSYRDKAASGNRGASFKYPCLSVASISSLKVGKLASENCCLFMWVTMPFLPDAFTVIAKWGFIYKTCAFTWIKRNKKAKSLFWGMGSWTRANTEICLLATKGKPKRVSASVHSVVISPIEKHSKKPDEVRDRIVKLCGDVPRIELFARQKTPGWKVWGNEV